MGYISGVTTSIFLTVTTSKPAIQEAADFLGAYRIAKVCGVKGPSVYKWLANGCLPRTEWTGETNYAALISAECEGKVSRAALLERPKTHHAVSEK